MVGLATKVVLLYKSVESVSSLASLALQSLLTLLKLKGQKSNSDVEFSLGHSKQLKEKSYF